MQVMHGAITCPEDAVNTSMVVPGIPASHDTCTSLYIRRPGCAMTTPWMVGMHVRDRSRNRPCHIHLTYRDAGNADYTGAIICLPQTPDSKHLYRILDTLNSYY